jgi:non-specific serine/threonine protein kinase
MTPERWHVVSELFRRALELAPEERDVFLVEACGRDAELRAEVDELLAEHDAAGSFLAEPLLAAERRQAYWAADAGAAGSRAPAGASGAAAARPLVGAVLEGKYAIEARLGTGGMGEVYCARDRRLGRPVAVKLMPAALVGDTYLVRRFGREARAASALNHPNIVVVYDVGEVEGMPYLVMEYVEGESLRARMARGVGLIEAVEVATQVAGALAAAHASGIVHRDIKPENVMVRPDGLVKVLDFGIAKLTEPAAEAAPQTVTRTGVVMGTAAYMSPEQARGLPVDGRTDVWSLGVVLYELISGRRPFEGPTPVDLLVELVSREPDPLERLVPELPVELARVVARALRKAVEERYATAGELETELKQAREAMIAAQRQAPAGTTTGGGDMAPVAVAAAAELKPEATTRAPTSPPEGGARLIGRERELEQVTATLRGDEARLLTLTGPGGVGKTRLAVEASRLLLDAFADGVFVVDLTPLSDPKLLASHVAEVFGLKEAPGTTIAERLVQHFSDKHLLLVLDNFEHLLGGASLVAELLGAAPRVRILVTSRALLRVRAEHEFEVQPLEVPSGNGTPHPQVIGRAPAVALFVERAREAKPSFALTENNAGAVAGICRRLEGLPLAIELAAARLRILTAESLLARLDERLRLLTGGARDLPERQQTMRGTIRWSYDLLEEAEQAVLRRLSVFAGGCTLEAAEEVASCESRVASSEGGQDSGLATYTSRSAQLATPDVLDGLESLLDKSLLRQREQPDGEARFLMLEVVREFARERLEASGEASGARMAHARYFLRLAREAEPHLWGGEAAPWMERLGREHENIRAALTLLLEEDAAEGVRGVTALHLFWSGQSLYREGREWVARALEAGVATAEVRTRLLRSLAVFDGVLGHLDAAEATSRLLIEESRASGDRADLARALLDLGGVLLDRREARQAWDLFEEALAVARDLGDSNFAAVLLGNLGVAARDEGDYVAARAYYEESLALRGGTWHTALNLLNLGGVSFEEGKADEAGPFYRRALAIFKGLGNTNACACALDGLAAVALERRETTLAARLGGAAEALHETVGTPLEPFEQRLRDRYVSKLRATVEPGVLDREWALGRATPFEEAAQLALEETDG